jgi:hypothetical protein
MPSADQFKENYMEMQRKLQKDMRPMIARSGFYNPDGDKDYEYQRYPFIIRIDGKEVGIANNEAEEKAMLGVKQEPAKIAEVDISKLAHVAEEPKREKRKYTKRETVKLPDNLE